MLRCGATSLCKLQSALGYEPITAENQVGETITESVDSNLWNPLCKTRLIAEPVNSSGTGW